MPAPLVTACLCAYNAERFIGQAIESILAQTYQNFLLFVVNDASEDNTLSIAKKYTTDARVFVIDLKTNIGTYAAKNFVLKNFANGKYWANHDADDYSSPDRFAKQIIYLESENLDGCGTAIDEFYEPGIEPTIPAAEPLVLNPQSGFRHRVNIYPKRIDKKNISDNIDDLPKLKIVMNGSLMFKLAALKELGGFDGETRIGGDSEFLWRFVKFYNFGNSAEVLYHRRFHSQSLTQSKSVGHNSLARKEYAERAKNKHIKCLELLNSDHEAEAKQASTYDFFYPPVDFKVYRSS